MREAIAIQRRVFPNGHRDLARGLNNLASLRLLLGDPDEAEALVRESLAMKRRLFGDRDVEVAFSLSTLAGLLTRKGQIDEAEELYRRSVAIRREVGGPDDPGLANALNNLATLLVEHRDRLDDAMTERLYGADHPHVGVLKKNQALLLAQTGELAACERLTIEALALLRQKERIAETESIRGGCLAALGRRDEAEPLLRRGFEALLETLGEGARQTRQAADRLAAFAAEQR